LSNEGYLFVLQIRPFSVLSINGYLLAVFRLEEAPPHVGRLRIMLNLPVSGLPYQFHIIGWLIALLDLSINGDLFLMFLLTQAPQNVGMQ
jgi:hypothetical protein